MLCDSASNVSLLVIRMLDRLLYMVRTNLRRLYTCQLVLLVERI